MFGLTALGVYAGIALSGFVSLPAHGPVSLTDRAAEPPDEEQAQSYDQNAQDAIDHQGSLYILNTPLTPRNLFRIGHTAGGLPLIQIEDRIGVSAPSMLRRTLGCTGFTRWASQPACMDWR